MAQRVKPGRCGEQPLTLMTKSVLGRSGRTGNPAAVEGKTLPGEAVPAASLPPDPHRPDRCATELPPVTVPPRAVYPFGLSRRDLQRLLALFLPFGGARLTLSGSCRPFCPVSFAFSLAALIRSRAARGGADAEDHAGFRSWLLYCWRFDAGCARGRSYFHRQDAVEEFTATSIATSAMCSGRRITSSRTTSDGSSGLV